VIAATNRDLRQEIKNGRFRGDLYHRLSVFSISVPPLREMGEDKTLLLAHFSRFYAEQAKLAPFTLDEGASNLWREYRFPGNVRELKNIVIRLTTKYPGQKLSPLELEPELEADAQPEASAEPAASGDPQALIAQAQRHLQRERHFNLDDMLKAWEQGYIEAAMRLSHGNVSQAARMLGINRTTLYSRMEQQEKK
jgi:DNA-binding NtrC family response regulator